MQPSAFFVLSCRMAARSVALCALAGWVGHALADGNPDLDKCTAAGKAEAYAAAIEYCSSALESKDLAPQNAAIALQIRGLSELNLRKFDEAIADFDKGIALDANNAGLFAARGWALQLKGASAQSISDLDRALTLDPDNLSALVNRGKALVDLGRYEDAIRDSSRAIEIDPSAAAPFGNRANAYKNLGNFGASMADYDRAIALDPKLAMIYNDRGTAYGEERQFALAIADFNRAIELDPGSALPYFNRGLTYKKMSQEDRAANDFAAALARDSGLAGAHKGLGDILAGRGDPNGALEHYESAIRLQPEQAPFYLGRAMASLSLGDYPRAVEDANHALTLDPKLHKVLAIKGFAQFLSGDFTAAALTFDLDLRKGTRSPYAMVYWYLARLRNYDDGGSNLSAYLANADLSAWPGPLLGHLQGYVSEEELLSAAEKGQSPTPAQRQCQARFALGEISLVIADSEAASRDFQEAVAVCPKSMPEYYGAKTELQRLK